VIKNFLALSFKFCFLNEEMLMKLSKAMSVTKTLVKLNLSHNGLDSRTIKHILDAFAVSISNLVIFIKANITIAELDLGYNELGNQFGIALADCLAKNEILNVVDISYNPV